MALLAGESGCEKRFRDLERERGPDHPRTDAQHVHIVVFDCLMRGVRVMAHRRTNARKFAGRNGHAGPAATDDDAALGLPVAKGHRDGFG